MTIKLSRVKNTKLTPAVHDSDNQIIETAINNLEGVTQSNGTVTNVSEVDTDIAEIMSVSISNPTSTPQFTFQRISKAQKLFYASPNNTSGKPTMRAITNDDLPTITKEKGGTGLTSTSNNKVLRTNSSGEYVLGAIVAKSTKSEVSINGNNIEIDVLPENIPINDLDTSIPLAIANGGSGGATAQSAINNLTQASSATTGHVLTRNSSGNVVFQALPAIGGGTVTTVTKIDTDVSDLVAVNISDPTTTPQFTFTKVSRPQKQFYASPSNASGNPTMRVIVNDDLPIVTKEKGGTGLATTSNNKVLRTNGSGEYVLGEIKAKTTKAEVTINGNDIEIDVLPANIEINDLKSTTALAISKGGTGQTTAQAAINALTNASAGTIGHVLTKNSSGNMVLEAIPNNGIADGEVTYVKIQAASPFSLIGNPNEIESSVSEITLCPNLIFVGRVLTQRQSIFSTKTSSYQMTKDDGVIYADSTSATVPITLPDTATLLGGEIFTVKRINTGANNVVIKTFVSGGLEIFDINSSDEYTLNGVGHSLTVQYVGEYATKFVFRVIVLNN